MNPCLVKIHMDYYFAWDLQGQLVCATHSRSVLDTVLRSRALTEVPWNHTFAKQIRENIISNRLLTLSPAI